jgi:hypothetical protein
LHIKQKEQKSLYQAEFFTTKGIKNMKYIDKKDMLAEAGVLMQQRDMSLYDGKPFECACGQSHAFWEFLNLGNFGTSGANAKMIVKCPNDTGAVTLIKTKNKFIFMFDRFISLAGCKDK